MSSELAIRAHRIGKKYRIGGRIERYRTFREALSGALTAPFHRVKRLIQGQRGAAADLTEEMWALRDVSFEVGRGEVIGIIGPNGAGKSTLLKILSRITEPTEGWAELHGRVGSLLEVGTGFHPELTGRENIFLNGAILGMKRAEIERRFEEIVAFSEVEKFINTPVKHYSSGMYLRLAFSVAAHMDPEILMIDEVLAVGDARFQKRCLGKMTEVAEAGRTVLFVSHNLVAVQGLCERVLWLDHGRIVEDGDPASVVSSYLKSAAPVQAERTWSDFETAPGNDKVRIRHIGVRPADPATHDSINVQTPFVVEVEFWNLMADVVLDTTLHVYTEEGIMAFGTSTVATEYDEAPLIGRGLVRASCYVPGDFLNNGCHRINVLIVKDRSHIEFQYDEGVIFEVLDSPEMRGAWFGKVAGVVRPKLDWEMRNVAELPEEAPVPSIP